MPTPTKGPRLGRDPAHQRLLLANLAAHLFEAGAIVTRPIKELRGFQKIALAPGETKTIALEITPESLAFYDVNMKFVVEPGEFEIMVGNSSRDGDLQKVILTVQ